MRDWIGNISSADNLFWAWSKAKQMFDFGDSWVDARELSRFEGNLNNELESIARDIKQNKYVMSSLRPILYPKKLKSPHEKELRQWFYVSVRDQVSWIAFINIVGPFLDYCMPSWAYSYRLYRPVWYKERPTGEGAYLKAGWYRNTSRYLYRKFNQSWPLYRRQIYLTAREITKVKYHKYSELTEGDRRVEERESLLSDEKLKLSYLTDGYWDRKYDSVYWASIDLKKFFPSVDLNSIKVNMKKYLADKWSTDLENLTDSLLRFPLDFSGFDKDELSLIFTKRERDEFKYSSNNNRLKGLPTGLFVSGFLSNVAMLEIDKEVSDLSKEYQVAHFRYVDDHTIISPNFDKLVDWIRIYKELLAKHQENVIIHEGKFEPAKLREYVFPANDVERENVEECRVEAKKNSYLDPKFPAPLMTKTLALVSAINDVEFELLDEEEQGRILEHLEHLLLVNIPNHELRVDTRISFAASKISRLAPIRFPHYNAREIYELSHLIQQKEEKLKIVSKDLKEYVQGSVKLKVAKRTADVLRKELIDLKREVVELRKKTRKEELQEKRRTFSLLLKTVQDYPEKLRVWVRLIDFCRTTAFADISPLFKKLKELKKECVESYYFYRGFVLEAFSKQIYLCLKCILDEDGLVSHKEASISFLLNVIKSIDLNNLYSERNNKYYESSAKQLLECSIGVALLVLQHNKKDYEYTYEIRMKGILERAKKYQYLNFKAPSKWMLSKSDYDISVWAWVADQAITFPVQYEPSIVWLACAKKLKPADELTWSFLKKYPQCLPKLRRVHSFLENKELKLVESGDGGFVYEYMRASSSVQKEKLSNIFGAVVDQKIDGYIDFYDWIDFLNKLKNKNAFDPRLSEWTAVSVVIKICSLYNIFKITEKEKISFCNYLMPIKWIDPSFETNLSWETWKNTMKDEIKLIEKPITDSRYTPIFLNEDENDKQFAPIRGLGVVLLVLLTHNYSLPSSWNPKGHSRMWGYLMKRRLQDTSCSSWTGIILEACLLPRSRENASIVWQREIFDEYDPSDMDGDPPLISNIDDLKGKLKIIQKKLSEHQLSVQNNLPRQLTPVSVTQLQRNIWFEEG